MNNELITDIVTSTVAIVGVIISIISLRRTSKTESLKNDLEKIKVDLEKERIGLEKNKFGIEFLEDQYAKIKKIQIELSKVQNENPVLSDGSNTFNVASSYFIQSSKIYREHYDLLPDDIAEELFQIQKAINTLQTDGSESPFKLQIEYFSKIKGFVDQKLKNLGKRIEMIRLLEE